MHHALPRQRAWASQSLRTGPLPSWNRQTFPQETGSRKGVPTLRGSVAECGVSRSRRRVRASCRACIRDQHFRAGKTSTATDRRYLALTAFNLNIRAGYKCGTFTFPVRNAPGPQGSSQKVLEPDLVLHAAGS